MLIRLGVNGHRKLQGVGHRKRQRPSARASSRISRARRHSGTRCSRFRFVRGAGVVGLDLPTGGGGLTWRRPCYPQHLSLRGRSPRRCGRKCPRNAASRLSLSLLAPSRPPSWEREKGAAGAAASPRAPAPHRESPGLGHTAAPGAGGSPSSASPGGPTHPRFRQACARGRSGEERQ